MNHLSDAVVCSAAADRDGPSSGQQATCHPLASGFKPTAIICMNDFIALGALRELREQGLSVPDDALVMGYDKIRLSEFVHPAITTVSNPRGKILHLVFEFPVTGRADSGGSGREFFIDPELVARESTGRAPKT